MKRIDKHQRKEYGPVKLRPADLRELFLVLEGREGLKLVADDIEFESLDELFSEYGGRIPNATNITASAPYLTVELNRLQARLYIGSSDIEASGLFAKLDAVLRHCERRPRFLFSFWRLLLAMSGLQFLSYLPGSKPYEAVLGVATIALIIVSIWLSFILMRRHSLVQTDTATTKSFWKRNSDSIAVAIISALIGAACGALVTKLTDHYFPAVSGNSATAPTPASSHNK